MRVSSSLALVALVLAAAACSGGSSSSSSGSSSSSSAGSSGGAGHGLFANFDVIVNDGWRGSAFKPIEAAVRVRRSYQDTEDLTDAVVTVNGQMVAHGNLDPTMGPIVAYDLTAGGDWSGIVKPGADLTVVATRGSESTELRIHCPDPIAISAPAAGASLPPGVVHVAWSPGLAGVGDNGIVEYSYVGGASYDGDLNSPLPNTTEIKAGDTSADFMLANAPMAAISMNVFALGKHIKDTSVGDGRCDVITRVNAMAQ